MIVTEFEYTKEPLPQINESHEATAIYSLKSISSFVRQ